MIAKSKPATISERTRKSRPQYVEAIAVIGQNIRMGRLSLGMDQKAFGRVFERSQVFVSQLENGKKTGGPRTYPLDLISAIAEVFHVPLVSMFTPNLFGIEKPKETLTVSNFDQRARKAARRA